MLRTPLWTQRCDVKLSGERLEKKHQHWQQVAISACEQCGRAKVPHVNPVMEIASFLHSTQTDPITDATTKLVLHHRDTQSLNTIEPKPERVILLIGPEGGLTAQEIESAIQANFIACTLGPRVLRTETAPVAALSVLQWLWGDFN